MNKKRMRGSSSSLTSRRAVLPNASRLVDASERRDAASPISCRRSFCPHQALHPPGGPSADRPGRLDSDDVSAKTPTCKASNETSFSPFPMNHGALPVNIWVRRAAKTAILIPLAWSTQPTCFWLVPGLPSRPSWSAGVSSERSRSTGTRARLSWFAGNGCPFSQFESLKITNGPDRYAYLSGPRDQRQSHEGRSAD